MPDEPRKLTDREIEALLKKAHPWKPRNEFGPKTMPIPREEMRVASLEAVVAEMTLALQRADRLQQALMEALAGLTTAIEGLIERVEALERR